MNQPPMKALQTDDPQVRRAARAHLRRADPVLATLIGPRDLCPGRRRGRLAALVRSIVGQQLGLKAAATIHGRLVERLAGQLTPQALLALDDATFRAAGISRQKTAALRDLARRADTGALRLAGLHRRDDAAVVEHLVQVRGIGQWTAEMFLIFVLARPDVLSVGDLGLQTAVQRAYGLRARPKPAALQALAEPWRPYRSVASWYLWASLGGWGV
jgi:DNA-3-methyladenine glycosylase II